MTLFCWFSLVLFKVEAQSITDSVFQIKEVQISQKRVFKKEDAGLKSERVDTLVMMSKLNATVSDLLAQNTSVYIKDYGRGALATASFRGTAPSHTQVAWNGININSPMLGMVDFSLIPVYVIDDVSLLHGSASITQGDGGLGGQINLDNSANWENRLGGRFFAGYGSFDTYDVFGQLNIGGKNFQSKTRAYQSYSKNDYEFVNKHIPVTDYPGGPIYFEEQKNTDAAYGKTGLMQELYFRPNKNWQMSGKAWYQKAFRSVPLVMSYEGNDTATHKTNRQTDNTTKVVVEARRFGEKLKSQFWSGIDYQELDYVMSVKVGGGDEQKPVNSTSDMLSWYNKAVLQYNALPQLAFKLNAQTAYYDISTIDSTLLTGYNADQFETSLFAEASYAWGQKVNLMISLGSNWIPDTETPLIYLFGASFKPFINQQLILKANVARNYHYPTLNDKYWQPGGNPDLNPEEGMTAETGMEYQPEFGFANITAELTGYYSSINHWIIWLPNQKGFWEPENLKKVNSQGLEFTLKASKSIKNTTLSLNGNYAYTKSVNVEPLVEGDQSANQQLPYIPLHSGNVFASVHNRGFYLNYQYSFYGERNLLTSNKETLADDSEWFGYEQTDNPYYRMYAQHLNSMAIGKTFKTKLCNINLEFKINNLFNEVYRNVLNQFMPQRYYFTMLKIDF